LGRQISLRIRHDALPGSLERPREVAVIARVVVPCLSRSRLIDQAVTLVAKLTIFDWELSTPIRSLARLLPKLAILGRKGAIFGGKVAILVPRLARVAPKLAT